MNENNSSVTGQDDELLFVTDVLEGQIAPVYKHYNGQHTAQPAYVYMDENGVVDATYNPEINGTPMEIFHGQQLSWAIPADISGDELVDFFQKPEIRAALREIHDGHTVEWDGNNHVGRLTEAAQNASGRLKELCDDLRLEERSAIWNSAGEWFGDVSIKEIWPANLTLDEAVASVISITSGERCLFDDDEIRKEIIEQAVDAVANSEEGLSRNQVLSLVAIGEVDEDEAADYLSVHLNETRQLN